MSSIKLVFRTNKRKLVTKVLGFGEDSSPYDLQQEVVRVLKEEPDSLRLVVKDLDAGERISSPVLVIFES